MALNIGNRQVNLDDLDTIIFDNSEIAVDPTTLDSVFSSILPLRDSFYSVQLDKHEKGKSKEVINTLPEYFLAALSFLFAVSLSCYKNRTLSKEECKAILTFALLCLLKVLLTLPFVHRFFEQKGGMVRKATVQYLCALINHDLIPQLNITTLYDDFVNCFVSTEFDAKLQELGITLPGPLNHAEKACVENVFLDLST